MLETTISVETRNENDYDYDYLQNELKGLLEKWIDSDCCRLEIFADWQFAAKCWCCVWSWWLCNRSNFHKQSSEAINKISCISECLSKQFSATWNQFSMFCSVRLDGHRSQNSRLQGQHRFWALSSEQLGKLLKNPSLVQVAQQPHVLRSIHH